MSGGEEMAKEKLKGGSVERKMGWGEMLRKGAEPYRYLLKFLLPYRRRFVMGLLCGVGFAVVNGLFPVVVLLVGRQVFGGSSEQFRIPGAMGRILEQVPLFQHPSQAGFAGVMMAVVVVPAVMLLRSTFSYLNSYYMAWVSYRMLQDLRRVLFAHLLRQGMDFFNRVKAGSLISRVTNDVRVAQTAFVSIAGDIFKNPFSIGIGAAVLFALDWKFCLVTLLLFPTCLVPVIVFGRKVRKAGKAEEEEAGTMSVILQESFLGIRIIQSFCREAYQERQFARSSEEQFRNSMRVRRATDIVQPLIEVVSAFGVALALLYVYYNKMAPERLLALMSGIFLLYDPAKKLSRLHMQLQKAIAASANVMELLKREPSVRDAADAMEPAGCTGRIEFRNVTFDYGTEVAALERFSLVVEPGKKYALVGPSGAGKTTVLSLLQRFYDPKEGEILLDGVDLRRLRLRWLREHIGVVSQESFLFHDTIFENVRFGRLDATREEVEEACRLAYAHDFILQQPQGYETVVGDKGCMLSGGQQQRIAIARAILKNAPILLLDEATSALDSESERMIQAALERLTAGRTVIAIAHRLSTILNSDCIVVMEKGRIVGMGRHEELLKMSEAYRRLYELQFSAGSAGEG